MKKRVLSFLLAFAMLCSMLPQVALPAAAATVTASGTCGENLTWTLDSNGILTISGTGNMYDYGDNGVGVQPWEAYCKDIVSVVIEAGVTGIGYAAFASCEKLRSVAIPEGVKKIGIGAFGHCKALEKVSLPGSLQSIGLEAFHSCVSLLSINIPEGVRTIYDGAFAGCDGLQTVTIPASVTYIGQSAFGECANLKQIILNENNAKYCLDEYGVLFTKDQTELLRAPVTLSDSYEIPISVTYIGGWAFYNCDNLQSITIHEGVTTVDVFAFRYCNALKSVNLRSSLTSLASFLFDGCTALQEIYLPNTITSIAYGAFLSCKNLKDVHYGGTQTQWLQITIGGKNEALTGANIHFAEKMLAGITITAPAKTEYWVGEDLDTTDMVVTATYSDGSTQTVTEGYTVEGYDANTPGEQTVTVTYEGFTATFTVTVKKPEPEVVASGTCGDNLTWKLDVNGLMTISGNGYMDRYSIGDCPWIDYRAIITDVLVEENVTSIGVCAFYGCENLRSVVLTDSVITIEERAFLLCTDLQSVDLGNGVTSLGNYAFSGCSSLQNISIPASVTTIGLSSNPECTFFDCSSLMGIWVDENNRYYSSDSNGVLFNKNKTQLVQAPGALSGIYEIPEGVTVIGSYAFSNCSKLQSVVVSDDVRSIGDWAFYSCINLKNISLGKNLCGIGACAFQNCTSLTEIAVPDTVTDIMLGAFKGCASLTQIAISDAVKIIGRAAFADCSSLKDVYYDGTAEQWEQISIATENDCLTGATIHFTETILYGDVDGDGEVSARDRAILTRYLADWEGYADQIDLKAADVNGDGSVDTRDRAILTRYLADWEDYPELPYTG